MPVMQHAFAEAELLDHRAGHERIGSLAGEVGRRVAEEAVAVGVHFEHARAGDERQRFAVVRIFVFEIVLAIGGHAAGATSSATPTATAIRAIAATPAATAMMTAAAAAAGLPVAVTSTATAALAAATSATTPTLSFTHVLQHLKQNSNQVRSRTNSISGSPRGREAQGNPEIKTKTTYQSVRADSDTSYRTTHIVRNLRSMILDLRFSIRRSSPKVV